ncbi:hypothetical protein RRG08_003989 [Elysia crispata]|uniref:Uncharacterized protein n=1 Tax=Elysia crispata TaxID=231223 RepID=A0AAE0Y5K8_9GAST|nr:hypothetical protein RRG08_003989 [Elysia crispata]
MTFVVKGISQAGLEALIKAISEKKPFGLGLCAILAEKGPFGETPISVPSQQEKGPFVLSQQERGPFGETPILVLSQQERGPFGETPILVLSQQEKGPFGETPISVPSQQEKGPFGETPISVLSQQEKGPFGETPISVPSQQERGPFGETPILVLSQQEKGPFVLSQQEKGPFGETPISVPSQQEKEPFDLEETRVAEKFKVTDTEKIISLQRPPGKMVLLLAFMAAVSVLVSGSEPPHQVLCPEGWTDITGECAKFFHEKRTWWDARKTCQDNGGDLLTSSTQPHLKNALHTLIADGDSDGLWVGSYGPIGRDSPTPNVGNKPLGGKSCFKISRTKNWVTERCYVRAKFVCEKLYDEFTCPDGWTVSPWSASCIRLEREEKSWDDARGRCQQIGLDLVKILNSEMNQLITTLIADGDSDGLWVGSYGPIGRDSPTPNKGNKLPQKQTCVMVSRRSLKPEHSCSELAKFACEKPYNELQCPDGWTVSPWSASCIRLEREEKSWDDARGRCQQLGADLVKIVNGLMNQLITAFISEQPATGYWIGLRNRVATDGNRFKWLDEEHPAKYTSWGEHRPKTKFPAICAEVHDSGVKEGRWNDANCEAKRQFICEKFQTRYYCPSGWELNPFTRTCFKVFDDKKSRDYAQAYCQSIGGNLGYFPRIYNIPFESHWTAAANNNRRQKVTDEYKDYTQTKAKKSVCKKLAEGSLLDEDCEQNLSFICEREPVCSHPEPCVQRGRDSWFGRSCKFQCQCANFAPCNKIHGACSYGCADDYMGPACQYLKMKPTLSTPGRLEGGYSKNRKCIDGISGYFLFRHIPLPITWMRVFLKTPAVSLNIRMAYYLYANSHGFYCDHHSVAKVDDFTFDVYCPTNISVYEMIFQGDDIKNVCQVEFSAGRNLAFREMTSPSSTVQRFHGGGLNTPKTYMSERIHCIQTHEQKQAFCMVTLRADVTVTHFKIVKPRSPLIKDSIDSELRLISFRLPVKSVGNATIAFQFSDLWLSAFEDFVPSPPINFPVRQFKITVPRLRYKTFYGLFIFGEIVCPPNRFGLTCEFTCNCAYNTSCFVHSGGCPAGCVLGYTGENCYTPIGRLELSNPAQLMTETVTNDSVRALHPLTIKCNAQVVQLPAYTEIVRLQISKGVSSDTGVEIIVDYDVFRGKAEFPDGFGTDRTFNVSGTHKIRSLFGEEAGYIGVEWNIYNPRCTDSTTYQCTVTYHVQRGKDSKAIATRSGQQYLTVVPVATAKLHNVSLSVTSHDIVRDGSKFTFITCVTYGPPGVELVWEKGSSNRSTDPWTVRPTIRDDCMYHRSTVLAENYLTDLGHYWFWCTAKLNGRENLTAFVNISLIGDTVAEKTMTIPDPPETQYNNSLDTVKEPKSATPCSIPGWFGSGCQHPCHCDGGAEYCDQTTGHCSYGCVQGWFGPGCQYDSIPFSAVAGPEFSLKLFLDRSDRTCLSSTRNFNLSYVMITLEKPVPLTWMRLFRRSSDKITLMYSNTSGAVKPCPHFEAAPVNEMAQDIMCITEDDVHKLHLYGPGVQRLCSLYISREPKSATPCSIPGWFGSGCQHPCHCDGGAEYCDQTTGHCSYGCVQGWFGPGCQYDSIPFSAVAGPEFSLKLFLDRSDRTCLSSTRNFNLSYVMITLEKPVPLTWMRLFRRSSDKIKLMYSSTSGAVKPCPHFEAARVNEMAQDIMCITEDDVHKLHLYGPGVQRLCSLYISRARNVALKQTGNHSQSYGGQHFRRVRNGETSCPSGRYGWSCEHQCNCAGGVDCFVHSGGCPAGCVSGYGGEDCQTLLETSCPSGRYGWSCEHQCNCAGGVDCFVHSGGCPAGCVSGYGGEDCQTLLVTNPSTMTPTEQFKVGKSAPPLDINCNADAVGLPSNFKEVVGLQLSKKLPGSTKIKKFVDYFPYHPLGVVKFTRHAMGRDFFYEFTGALNDSKSQSKTRALSVKWTISQPSCMDSGVYFCNVTYVHSNILETRSGQQTIRSTRVNATAKQCFGKIIEGDFGTSFHQEQLGAKANMSNVILEVTPKLLDYEFIENDVVIFFCTASGSPNLRLLWRWGLTNSKDLQVYTKKEDMTFIHFQKHHDDFGLLLYKSTLTLKMRSEYDGKMFLCEAHHDSQTVKSAQITVRVFDEYTLYQRHGLKPFYLQVIEKKISHERMWEQVCKIGKEISKQFKDILKKKKYDLTSTQVMRTEVFIRIHDFLCFHHGFNMLETIKNSTCVIDKHKFQAMKYGVLECDGQYSKAVTRAKSNKENLLKAKKKWDQCVTDVAFRVCSQTFGLYISFIFDIQDEAFYSVKNHKNCYELSQCDNDIFGVDLSHYTIKSWILNSPAYYLDEKCLEYKHYATCVSWYEKSCKDEEYKLRVRSYVDILDHVCSERIKRSPQIICRKGSPNMEKKISECHSLHASYWLSGQRKCRKLQEAMDCMDFFYELDCIKYVTMEIFVVEISISGLMLEYQKLKCSKPKAVCPLNCNKHLDKHGSFDSLDFQSPKQLDDFCADRVAIERCFEIVKIRCPDDRTKEEMRVSRKWLDVLCTDLYTSRKERDSFGGLCSNCFGIMENRTCLRYIPQNITSDTYSIVPSEADCKLIRDAEICIRDVINDECNCKTKYGELLFNIWLVSLKGNVVALRKKCHARCPDGWSLTPSSDNCIRLFDEDKNWNEARRACFKKYHLAHLIRITDPRKISFVFDFIAERENGMKKFWIKNVSNPREVTGVYKPLFKIPQTEYRHASEDCLMMSNSTLYSTYCSYKFGYICETPAEDCSHLTRCINHIFGGSLAGKMDLIYYFMKNGAGQLAQVCVQLAECWERHGPLCASEKHNQEIKVFMDALCSQVGWDLIDKAHKQCLVGYSYGRMRSDVYEIQKTPLQEDYSLCPNIFDQLENMAVKSDARCGAHAAMLVSLFYIQQLSLRHKGYSCGDMDITCWGLKSCLRNLGDFASGQKYQWENIIRPLSEPDLRNLCSYKAHISTCFNKYGHYCTNNALVEKVKTQIDVLQYACSTELIEFEWSFYGRLILFLKEKCVDGFYDSLTSADRQLIREHAWDAHHSDALCKRIKETEKDCVERASTNLVNIVLGVNNYKNHKIWLEIWLRAMGETFIRARERCYNVSPCPPWTITKSDGMGCLVVYRNKTYHDASTFCQKKGGHLVSVSDWKMFFTIKGFLIKWSSNSIRKFSFWILRSSPLVKYLSESKNESGLCSAITRETRRHFWQVTDRNCTERAHFICQEQTQCKVQAACPSNLKLSPDSKDCVKINYEKNFRTFVCRHIGMRLLTFKPNDLGFFRFLRNLTQSAETFLWIKINMTQDDAKRWFTRDLLYRRKWEDFYRDSSHEMCAVISYAQPMILESYNCSLKEAAVCARDPIECPGGYHGPIEPSLLRLEKVACPSGWLISDNTVCIRIYPYDATYSRAAASCIQDGGELLEFPSKDTYSWESFGERLDESKQYWVGLQGNDKESYRYISFQDKDYWKVKVVSSSELYEAEESKRNYICGKKASNWARDSCPEGMFAIDDLCVELNLVETTWSGARKSCQLNGGDLMKISANNTKKRRLLYGILNEYQRENYRVTYWLGMRSDSKGVCWWLDESPTEKPRWVRLTRHLVKYSKGPFCLQIYTTPLRVEAKVAAIFRNCSSSNVFFCEYPAFGRVAPDASPCGSGWSEMESSCIKIFKRRLPWSEARTQCKKLGGNLLKTISTGKMWHFFEEHLSVNVLYWIGEAASKSGETALQCGAIRLTSSKDINVVTLSDCHKPPKDGYICEKKPYIDSTGSQ